MSDQPTALNELMSLDERTLLRVTDPRSARVGALESCFATALLLF